MKTYCKVKLSPFNKFFFYSQSFLPDLTMLKVAVFCLVLVAMIDGSALKFHPRDKDVISMNQMEDTPAFCNKLDCPRYSLVKKTKVILSFVHVPKIVFKRILKNQGKIPPTVFKQNTD